MNKIKTFFAKSKTFFSKNKSSLLHGLYIFLGVVGVSLLSLLLLALFGVVRIEDGITFNAELFVVFKSSWYGWIAFILVQTVLSMLLCVIPGAAMAITLLSMAIFSPFEAFVISFISAQLASYSLYAIGRFGGYRLCVRFMGGKDCEKALKMLRNRGTVYFPIFMALPTFPDEALTMIAGTIKMSLAWFVPSIIIARGIGIAAITFGLGNIPFSLFGTLHWIIFVVACLLITFAVLLLAHRINVSMEKRRLSAEAKNGENQ
jgi:uncharacterized membrane protein YdjX (TVP38/TMEM64 family)